MIAIRFPPIPYDTARASEAAYGKGHPYLKIGDRLSAVFSGINLETVASADAQLAESFWPFSLVTVLQYWENLTDRQMANATRTRVELKYALHLPLIFPGMDPSPLCQFRHRLLRSQAGRDAFQQVIDHLEVFICNQDKPLADSNLVISEICTITRWEMTMGTMSNAIEALAASHPEWLRAIALPHWYNRYSYKQLPQSKTLTTEKIEAALQSVAEDGQYLLLAIEKSEIPKLINLSEIRALSQEWQLQFDVGSHQQRLCLQCCSNCIKRVPVITKMPVKGG